MDFDGFQRLLASLLIKPSYATVVAVSYRASGCFLILRVASSPTPRWVRNGERWKEMIPSHSQIMMFRQSRMTLHGTTTTTSN
jgi:hypothetical protein